MKLAPEYDGLIHRVIRASYGERREEVRSEIGTLLAIGKLNSTFHDYLIGVIDGRYQRPPLGK